MIQAVASRLTKRQSAFVSTFGYDGVVAPAHRAELPG